MANKRPDGDGLVRKRSDGRWEGRIVVGHKEDGKPNSKSWQRRKRGFQRCIHERKKKQRDLFLHLSE